MRIQILDYVSNVQVGIDDVQIARGMALRHDKARHQRQDSVFHIIFERGVDELVKIPHGHRVKFVYPCFILQFAYSHNCI